MDFKVGGNKNLVTMTLGLNRTRKQGEGIAAISRGLTKKYPICRRHTKKVILPDVIRFRILQLGQSGPGLDWRGLP